MDKPRFNTGERFIAGQGWNPDGYSEAWMAITPEPATLSLMALGDLAMLPRRCR